MSEQVIMLSLVDFVNTNNVTKHYKGIKQDAADYCGVLVTDGLFNRVFSSLSF